VKKRRQQPKPCACVVLPMIRFVVVFCLLGRITLCEAFITRPHNKGPGFLTSNNSTRRGTPYRLHSTSNAGNRINLNNDDKKNAARSEKTRLQATMEFQGESTTSIEVPLDAERLREWMLSRDSDVFFLGTSDVAKRDDGLWDTFQPSVEWFGLQLVPVFVIQLDRCKERQQVSAVITEARSDIQNEKEGKMGKIIQKAMTSSTFRGGNTIALEPSKHDASSSVLTADLSLTLSIPLPRFVPLPPGFNKIGSRIVQSTCKRRLKQQLASLQDAYQTWQEQTQPQTQLQEAERVMR